MCLLWENRKSGALVFVITLVLCYYVIRLVYVASYVQKMKLLSKVFHAAVLADAQGKHSFSCIFFSQRMSLLCAGRISSQVILAADALNSSGCANAEGPQEPDKAWRPKQKHLAFRCCVHPCTIRIQGIYSGRACY